MDQDLSKLRETLNRGVALLNDGDEDGALEVFSWLMTHIPWDVQDERASILHEAYQGMCQLSTSRDECIWEMASQIAGDYAAQENSKDCHSSNS